MAVPVREIPATRITKSAEEFPADGGGGGARKLVHFNPFGPGIETVSISFPS